MADTQSFMEVPETVRGMMKTSVEQARNAFNAVVQSTEEFVQGVASAAPATPGCRTFNEKVAQFTRQNAEANFNFASRLAEVRQLSEMVELQSNFLRQQMETYARQAEELREIVAQIVKESAQTAGSFAQNATQGITPKF